MEGGGGKSLGRRSTPHHLGGKSLEVNPTSTGERRGGGEETLGGQPHITHTPFHVKCVQLQVQKCYTD